MLNRLIYFLKKGIRPLLKNRVVHFIGDSHTEVFWFMEFSPLYFWRIIPKIKIVHGATATGLANPNSKTNAMEQFNTYLSREVKKGDYVVFQLGEVDCGFAIWYRAEKHGISVNEQMDLAIKNYSKLIKRTMEKAGQNIIICSAVLPTIKDKQLHGEVANLRKEITESMKSRTDLTLSFNNSLQKIAIDHEVFFLNLDNDILDKRSGTVDSAFLNTDPLDHHLNPKALSKVIYPQLIRFLFN